MEYTETFTVLLADDDPGIRELLTHYIERQGYLVTSVADGREALEKFKDFHFDICVLDIKMPYLSGVQLVDQIRELKSDVGVVFITGLATDQEVDEIYNENKGVAIIKKPFKCQTVGNYLQLLSDRLIIEKRKSHYKESSQKYWNNLPLPRRLYLTCKKTLRYLHETYILYLIVSAIIVSSFIIYVNNSFENIEYKQQETIQTMYEDMKELLKDWKVKDLKE
jgi:CheY-like chemotaxis protein